MFPRVGKTYAGMGYWAAYILIVLKMSESRWAMFGATLGLVTVFPTVNGATHRDDLPDNGFRFLPEDLEKVIPSSLPLNPSSLDGNSENLKSSFITLAVILSLIGILFGFLSWRRWRKDQELFETMFATYESKKQMLRCSQDLAHQLEEKVDVGEWTSVEILWEKEHQSVDTPLKISKELELCDSLYLQRLEALEQNLHPNGSKQPTQFPQIVIPIDLQPSPTLDPNLNTAEDLSGFDNLKLPSPVPTVELKIQDETNATELSNALEEVPNVDEFHIKKRKTKTRDSIQIQRERKRKNLRASLRSST